MGSDLFIDEELISQNTRSHPNNSAVSSLSKSSSSSSIQTMRRRFDTEETFRIRNYITKESAENVNNSNSNTNNNNIDSDYHEIAYIQRTIPYQEEDDIEISIGTPSAVQFSKDALTMNEDDNNSFVSALTTDDALSNWEKGLSPIGAVARNPINEVLPPPMEVSFCRPSSFNISRIDELVANLAKRPSTSLNSRSVSISCNDSSIELWRPTTIGRKSSCPTVIETGSSIPENFPIIVNGIAMDGIRHRDGDMYSELTTGKHVYSSLVGDRRRRVHRRSHSGAEISVGSLVGQSTLLTEPSSGGSFTDSEASSVRRTMRSLRQASTAKKLLLNATGADDGIGCCQARRPKSLVKKELKYMVGMVTAPIRLLPIFREKKARLKRSTGSLV